MKLWTPIQLVREGLTLLLLDVPKELAIFGFDTQFSVGPAFRGIKMIPPGPHFLYYRYTSRFGEVCPLGIGFFIDGAPSEVIVRKWDQQEDRLVKDSEEEEERFSHAVKSLEFDSHLDPYNLTWYGAWKSLSNYLTKDVIKQREPIGGDISLASELGEPLNGPPLNGPKTFMEQVLDKQLKTGKFTSSSSVVEPWKGCYYTSIPRLIKKIGMGAEELTSLNLDKSELLESILAKDYSNSEDSLIGELQFAYIAFLLGNSQDSIFQWRSLVSLLFGCVKAPFRARSKLFTKFIKVIYYQLKSGLQDDRDESNYGRTGALLHKSFLSDDVFPLHRLCKDFFSLEEDAQSVAGALLGIGVMLLLMLLVEDAQSVDGDLLTWMWQTKEAEYNWSLIKW